MFKLYQRFTRYIQFLILTHQVNKLVRKAATTPPNNHHLKNALYKEARLLSLEVSKLQGPKIPTRRKK